MTDPDDPDPDDPDPDDPDPDDPDRGRPLDPTSRESVLVITLALAGLMMTLATSTLPVIADVPRSGVFAVVDGAADTAGYLAMAAIAARPPVRWELVRRVGWAMIAVAVLGGVWAAAAGSGADFLLAMSGLMAVVVIVVSPGR